ncbi:MAG: AI-2E family transporter, partial [Chloroflexota bacterium]|nr:AI-2E family transporter [Chloroflexota bacterium]
MQQTTTRRMFFWGLFALITIGVLALIRPYISTIIFSLTMVVVLKPSYDFFLRRKWVKGPGLATGLTILAFLLAIAIPFLLLINITVAQAKAMFGDITLENFVLGDVLADITQWLQQIPAFGDLEFDREGFMQAVLDLGSQVVSWLANLAVSLGTSLPNMLVNLFLFFGFLVTLLPSFDQIIEGLKELLPLESPITETYVSKSTLMIKSMFLGIFVLSIIQGLAMGVVFVLAGVPSAGLWTMLSIALSIIPLVGVSLIALPMGIGYLIIGNVYQGVVILVGFYGFVNWIDTLLRPRMMAKDAHLHPMLLVLSVFGGLALAGLMGVVYGPVIMILFVTTIEVYSNYYQGNLMP